MGRLLDFLRRYSFCFLFLFLEAISLFLLFGYNRYQRGVFLTSASFLGGRLYSSVDEMMSYLSLREENRELLATNSRLLERLENLEQQVRLGRLDSMDLSRIGLTEGRYSMTPAMVIKNSVSKADNFLTLDKGSVDGMRQDMGVIGHKGVVGVVYKVSSHYSLVMSLLNSKTNLSCSILGKDYFGYLKWKGTDVRRCQLVDLPRHADVSVGDTVQTSGYSDIFPSGILIGVIDRVDDSTDGLSYDISVRLLEDLSRLSMAVAIRYKDQEELRSLTSGF